MKLPNRESAYIPPAKLVNYLLSPTHPVGGPKARFFRSAGFDESNAAMLERTLIDIARSGDVTEVERTQHGTKYAVEGDILTPAKVSGELGLSGLLKRGSSARASSRRTRFERQESRMIKELDTVVLTRDVDGHGLKRGDVGAVVHAYAGGETFEVEFVTADGRTVALLTLNAREVRPPGERDILHVRELAAA